MSHVPTRNPICLRMFATTLCEDSEVTASDKGYFRNCRTLHSSHLLRDVARPEVVRNILGHANIDVTQNVYGKSGWKCPRRSFPANAMGSRVRHCVECPKCFTRYLPAYSPYHNGSYLMPLSNGFADEWTLYCACGRPPISSRWSWSDLKLYAVSHRAHERGYGQPEEIVPVDRKSRFSG
jgi:hypothetical protein